MKILCDVCGADAASVFCCADEAALCGACDRSVHGANRLAGKHPRLALLPADSDAPAPCDVCKEKRGLLFCQQDRAILCRSCDSSVHSSSELAAKHVRFLLAGAALSSKPMPTPNSAAEASCNNGTVGGGNGGGSSISEYLTKTLPGWHVEDFLHDNAAAAAATTDCFYNQANDYLMSTENGSEGYIRNLPITQRSADAAKEQRRRQGTGGVFTVPHFESDCSSKRHRTAFW